ncbi:hypothetical protein BDQ17DRAFT_1322496 [Cyathus striatus]|nr:hypothetical protein BDQ17DRAFT_1322496 [Cyathus striatus]
MSPSADIASFTSAHTNNLVHSNMSATNPSSISPGVPSSDRTASPNTGAAATSSSVILSPSLPSSSKASLSSPVSPHMPIPGARRTDINFNMSPDLAVPTPSSSSSSSSFLSPAFPGTVPPRFLQEPSLSEVAPRSSSLPFFAMGHSYSKSSPPASVTAPSSPAASTAPKSASSAASTGSFNLRRAIAGRRKKSEDSTTLFSRTSGKTREEDARQFHPQEQRRIDQMQTMAPASSPQPQLQAYQHQQKQIPAPLALSPTLSNTTQVKSLPLAQHMGAKQLTQLASQVFSKRASKNPTLLAMTSPDPPTPPPKSARHARPPHAQHLPSPPPLPETFAAEYANPDRMSIIPISPAISSAVNYLRMREDEKDSLRKEDGAEKEGGSGEKEKADKSDMKESWRKSDSTISHHTIRPGATTGTRGSRPVSMAESLQSTHTIVPVSKRQSALIDDADFGMPEEEDEFRAVNEQLDRATTAVASSPPLPSAPVPEKSSTASLKSKNRRSMSLSLGHLTKSQSQGPAYHHSASVTDLKHPSISYTEGVPPTPPASDSDHGFYASSSVSSHSTAGSGNIRGKFAAWTGPSSVSSFSSSSSNRQERTLPAVPQPPSLRQTAISMTTGFSTGFAKRAVEKMGRAWGMNSNSSASSSASSSIGPSSFNSSHMDYGLARTSSNTSTPSIGHIHVSLKGKHRRTPGGASGTHSVTSSMTSGSESEYTPALGRQLRGRMRSSRNGGGVAGGVVFGRELKAAVRDTAVGVGREGGDVVSSSGEQGRGELKKLEERKVPALVVRCAQHMLVWGVQEEGLFRVSGRATHTNKIRSEFDTGADYDMLQCSPSDLDPHAVASVFKAYLRELPEPILTTKLSPYFDAAISKEAASNPPELFNSTSMNNSKGQGLPSNPRSGGNLPAIRKAPSLSTLAMPSFAGMKPPSRSLINALRSLVAQLPDENRDLLRTLVELVNTTSDHKETKMPLSNLLLVLCPSLNMNAPLLRSLCEAREIWIDEEHVMDIKRESVILNITAPSTATAAEDDDGDEEFSDANDGNEATSLQDVDGASMDEAASDYDASGESSLNVDDASRQKRSAVIERTEVPTVYLDTQSRFSNNSISSSTHELGHTCDVSSTNSSLQDTSSLSSNELDYPPSHQYSIPPPPLSRSTDSVVSPPTSSSQPSLTDFPLNEVQRNCTLSKSSHDITHDMPRVAELTPLSLNPAVRKPAISSPIPSSVVQFPSYPTVENLHSPPTPSKRRSIPLLSLPTFSPLSGPQPLYPDDSASQRGLRGKKPSLRLLFSKRSTSSLNNLSAIASSKPVISAPIPIDSSSHSQSPRSASDSSVSTPLSVVTAPLASSVSNLPPVLDTPIEGSSLALELGISISPPSTASTTDQRDHTVMDADPPESLKPGQTPIADKYTSSPASSQVSLAYPASQLRPTPIVRGRGASISSTASSNHLGVLDNDDSDEDWTRSVLLAADANGEWKIDRPVQA